MSLETSALPVDAASDTTAPAAWPVAVLVLAGLAATAAAGWIGYRQGLAAPGGPFPAVRQAAAAPGRAASAPDPLAWPLWEFQLRQPIPPRNPPLTPPPWRLVGATLASEGWRVVVLRQGNGTPEYFGVGQELPGGYRIQSINDEEVTLLINKREVTLSYTGSR
ncbi:hypothetical protein ABXN37_01590 [Piscinibacter sakaiensis]|uniref:hypothetical protein n=1 Tax=Piscinibacter sakaiensis TaxID=1547922 RepID=UPI0037268CE5